MAKKPQKWTMLLLFAIFRPVRTIKTLQKYFYLVEEVLCFDLVGHMWKLVKNLVSKMHFLWEILWKIFAGSFSQFIH